MHLYELLRGRLLAWHDIILAPIFILILIVYTKVFVLNKYNGTVIKQYVMPALYVRIIGCLLSALMYQYYYNGGDTFSYFSVSSAMSKKFWSDPSFITNLMFTPIDSISPEQWAFIKTTTGWFEFGSNDVAIVIKIATVLNLFTFGSYLGTGLILTYFSFLGCWKLFLVFYELYPKIYKQVAFSTLFIPSVFFWGAAGLMKDTITMACVGYFTFSAYNLFIKGRFSVKFVFQLLLSFILMFTIKAYIAIAFLPALGVWLFMVYSAKVKDTTLRLLMKPFFILLAIVVSYFLFQKISAVNEKYSQDQLIKQAVIVGAYIKSVSDRSDGSSYDLGVIEPTPIGVLKVAPRAINVALFRPYIWEIRKPILLPSAFEAAFFLLFTLYIFFNTGIIATIKYMFSDPNVLFCLTFAITFALAVGLASFNFGSLARYKIPCIPFYFLALFILYNKKLGKT